ncbi:MAG: DDE-type integrase/transposase/recombinase [Phycisphaeraceae bacterium]
MSQPHERSIWVLIDAISVLFAQAYMASRARALGIPSSMTRVQARRDHAYSDSVLRERELAIFRGHRQNRPVKQRLHYTPKERAEILQLMRLHGWSTKETAARFVVHPNTIRNWKWALREKHRAEDYVGSLPWNKLHAGVRWLVHEIRSLCPEREFGTRTSARHSMRAGIQISRASVLRILEEKRPSRPPRCTSSGTTSRIAPDHFFDPPCPNHVWHMDMTVFRLLWLRYEVAAIIDGFSRKILALKVFSSSPSTDQLLALIDEVSGQAGLPRYFVTDRGGQFQKRFRNELRRRGIEHARGRAQTWQFNAKIERLLWSLKSWWRVSLMVPSIEAVQTRLDGYATWHNLFRPHAALGIKTPVEAFMGSSTDEPMRYSEGGEFEPQIRVRRQNVRGDPRLHFPVILVRPKIRFVA